MGSSAARLMALVALALAGGGPALARPPNLVFWGHYCGPGNDGAGLAPVDALDAACARHDACTPTGRLPDCACNDRLRRESAFVAGDQRQPEDLRAMAGFVSAGAAVLACVPGGISSGDGGTDFPAYVSPSYAPPEAGIPDRVVPYDPYHD